MPTTQQDRVAPPLPIAGLLHSVWGIQILKTAVELDVFSALQPAPMDAPALAKKLSIDPQGSELVLNALTAMNLLNKEGGKFSLNETSRHYLVKDSVLFLGDYIAGREDMKQSWANLTQTVRTGKPHMQVNQQNVGEQFFQHLAAMIFPLSYTTSQSLADRLGVGNMKGQVNVLDLAAGSGVWSIPMAQANKNVNVDALDFPPIVEVTERFATKFGVQNQYSYLRGNWRDIELPMDHYDFMVLGHILHSEGKELSKQLLQKCFAALKPGGTIAVAEFLSNRDRTGPLFSQLFAVNMMVATSSGCVFSVEELVDLMESVGLKRVDRLELPSWGEESPVVVGVK